MISPSMRDDDICQYLPDTKLFNDLQGLVFVHKVHFNLNFCATLFYSFVKFIKTFAPASYCGIWSTDYLLKLKTNN